MGVVDRQVVVGVGAEAVVLLAGPLRRIDVHHGRVPALEEHPSEARDAPRTAAEDRRPEGQSSPTRPRGLRRAQSASHGGDRRWFGCK